MGVMTAYASHMPNKHKHLVADEKIISYSDLSISIIGGFCIYSMLGHICHLKGFGSDGENAGQECP